MRNETMTPNERKHVKRLKNSLLAAACLTVGVVAHARADILTYTGYTVLDDQNVTVQFGPPGQQVTERSGAGQITLTGTNTPGGSLATWCIDLADYLLAAGQFNQTDNGGFADGINALISHFDPTNYDASAATQVAIWRQEYGPFATITPDNANVSMLADCYISNVNDGTWQPDQSMQTVRLIGVSGNQDQATLVPVPEPASMAILGAGMVGMGVLRRKRA